MESKLDFYASFSGLLLLLLTLFVTVDSLSQGIFYVAGQRCRLQKCTNSPDKPPIVLLGGMAQTVASWEHHVAGLSQDRDLLLYECLGQGPPRQDDTIYQNVSLPIQAQLLCDTIQQVFSDEQVDLVGFSLGGRVAMAAACKTDLHIRRLHLSGVGAHRSASGAMAVESWKDILSHTEKGIPRGFAWSALLATYSPTFLQSNQARLSSWVQHVVDSNDVKGLRALVEQTYVARDDPWYTINMAKRIKSLNSIGRGRLVVGELDLMAPLQGVQLLQEELGWDVDSDEETICVFENSGHAIPMEQPREWRNNVLSFLDKD